MASASEIKPELADGEREELGGKIIVPAGVAVEKLKSYHKEELKQTCPEEVKKILDENQLTAEYDKLIKEILSEGKTRNFFGKWKDKEVELVVDQFREAFSAKGVHIVVCKRSSAHGTKRWLEFIDVDVAPDYVPQFDISNFSGQTIKTVYCTLEFPNGVAVEEMKTWKGRKRLLGKQPELVKELMEAKDLQQEYEELVERAVEEGVSAHVKSWSLKKLESVVEEFRPRFKAKGVQIYLSHKEEYVSHGQYGGHTECFRWFEFVDEEEQPNYRPQRDVNDKKERCVVS